MNATKLLLELLQSGAQVWVEGDELCYRATQAAFTPPRREQLSERKAEIIALLAKQNTKYSFPSFAQQRLWLLQQLEPDDTSYNISRAIRVKGVLDVGVLRKALGGIVARQEALRTTFAVVDGSPLQVISPALDMSLPIEDLSSLPGAEREEAVQRWVHEEKHRPFDLERGPLFRAGLLRLGEEEHVLVVTMHHIVSDGWSLGVFWRELGTLYEAFLRGEPSPLEELPIQYADYALWQRQWLTGEVLEEQLGYWKEQLAELPILELPTDHPRPAVQTHRGARRSLTLPESLTRALKELSRQEGITLFMVLLGAFQALLARYSGQQDIAVGSPIAGRNQAETEELMGFFVNTLVMRTDLSGDPSFREVLSRVREVALGAYDHQDLPFEKLVEELQPERDLSRTPLFQVFFNMQNIDDTPVELSRLRAERIMRSDDEAMFDLTLYVAERHDSLHIRFVYDADLFDESTIERMLDHFRTLLEGIAADPEQRLSQLQLLTEGERHRLLVEWNDTRAEYPEDRCVHELFEEQVERTPDAVAVAFEDQQLSYRELNRRANQLAHHLRALGVGPEVLVGICVERSLEMVVGLLGILKAGGAYVPLDPAYPKERLSFMLEDAKAPVLLTQERLFEGLPEHGAEAVRLDTGWEEIAKESGENLIGGARFSTLAYVIYTSGSTGKPKGVQISHGALTNFLCSMRWRPGLTGEDVLLAVTTLSFDIAMLELFLPLTVGARVVMVSRETASDGNTLLERLISSGATIMQATPATWRLLLEAGWEGSNWLKVLCGGEALPKQLAGQMLQRCSSLWNMYGPTEATIWSTVHKVEPETDLAPGSGPVPIGRPIANTTAYVLDSHLRPVPVGVGGELHIGGESLARGYLGRPELTAEKFISDPFDGGSPARLYKTGDLVRYLPDGSLEYLGRLDDQVKVRGFRIELGEIETVLDRHPAVRRAVVSAKEGTLGDKQLVAYVVPGSQPRGLLTELKGYLQKKLPAYMVPSTFTLLGEVPLTPNGKVNRKALPAPDPSGFRAENAYAEPRTPVEEQLVEIWKEVLGLEQVGIHDDFFELGGHSLLATRVVSRVRKVFQVELPLLSLFEEPTIAGLAERIEEARRGAHSLMTPPLVPAPRDAQLPLSFSQQRMWLLDQLEPDTPTYNISNALRLSGGLDTEALKRSLKEIVSRHESLRTTFAAVDGEPVQVISPTMDTKLPVADLSGMPQAERELEAKRLALEEKCRPFDLERGPLVRTKLVRLDQEEHLLLLTMHHIVSDGWSLGVFWRELGTLYEAFLRGEPSPLEELPIQYADYALWQRQWLTGEVLEEQLGYWKEQLAELPILELPTDHPRPAVQTHRGARRSLTLPESLTRALKELSRQEGITLFMVLLGAFQALLARYSGQQDIAVGSPIAGRNQAETEELMGFFVNTLVMRTDLSGDPSFREVLSRVREVALGAYDHQDLPFEKLVEELQPERDLSRVPLSQVFFALQNVPREDLKLPNLALERQDVEGGTVKFDLSFFMSEEKQGLKGGLVYNADLFDESTIERMLDHFRTLLEGIAADPEQRLSQLQLLTEGERHRLLVEWNDTRAEYPEDRCVHELFEEQVERTPDAVAVAFEDQQLSYRELNRRANQLAHHLRALGVGPEVLVGICVERSLEMVVGLLGILKAGGAYVPLDPAYPKERLSFMLEDAKAPVLLTQERLFEGLPEHGTEAICLDADWPVITRNAEENLTSRATPDNLAYVIYTSGSTGQPKGTMIEHRALGSYVAAAIAAYEITASARVLQFASLSFDASVEEIFPTLICGGTLVLRSDRMVDSMQRFVRECTERAISVLDLPTGFWHELVLAFEREGLALPPSVRLVIIGGEKALAERVAQWHTHTAQTSRPARLINTYGPTEATVVATLCELRPEASHGRATQGEAPIGRPLGNTRIYILDSRLNPVPIGVAGKLHIGGLSLARGYLNRPELTSERFIPDPFSDSPKARLYKTGDIARWDSDGNIEFLGRMDEQIKIRGFRIEPGEVEAALAEHPAVRQSVLVAREDKPGDKRLVAYFVVSDRGQEPTTSELRAFMKAKLPDYMVPSAFVKLEALPLTPNGKIDRKTLPAPNPFSFRTEEAYAAPRTPVEEVLVGVWEEVLGLGRVGIHDDFFELGGHSLLATRVISRVRKVFQVELPLRSMFEAPTIAGLAERIEEARRGTHSLTAPPLLPVSRDAQPLLSFSQQRMWLLDQLEPGTPTYNISNAVRLSGALDAEALKRSLKEIVSRHEALRTTFSAVDGEPVQVIAPSVDVDLPVEDLSGLPEAQRELEAKRLAREEGRSPFDLEGWPLVRAKLVRLDQEEHLLLLTMHHIVSDGWSLGVFWRELGTLYEAFLRGEPSPLEELPIQYADYALWQRQWLTGEVLEEQLGYWKEQLAELPILELPTDHPRPAVQTHRGARQSLELSREVSAGLKELARREGVTLFMVLLGAFQVLLSRYAGQEDVAVGTPIAGRNQAETEGLIGFFVNTLVMRTDLSGDPSFKELLSRVREVALGAYDHQDLPFEKLVAELRPERDLSRTPLFQVFLNMQNRHQITRELSGLKVDRISRSDLTDDELARLKFDFTLSVSEQRGGLRLLLVYNVDLFDDATIEQMGRHFRTLLEGVVADPEQRLSHVVFDALPLMLNDNDKVGRQAPPAPEASRQELEGSFVAPRTPVEERLVEIWEEVLGLERVGVHDDFFELGGHSLLAVRVVTRLNQHFGVELPLLTLFEDPTIAGLALAVTQLMAESEVDVEQMLAQVEQLQDWSVPQVFSEER